MASNILSGLAFAVSLAALVVSWVYGKRNADAAKVSADEASRVSKAEREREHRDYAPTLEGLKFEWETNPRTKQGNQFMTFTLPRTYRIHGDLISDSPGTNDSRTPLGNGTGGPFEAGTTNRIYVSDDVGKQPKAVELRFFPPVEGDPGESWSCPCDRPTAANAPNQTGHWVTRLEVPPRAVTMVTWA
jgi:hypothetical protein